MKRLHYYEDELIPETTTSPEYIIYSLRGVELYRTTSAIDAYVRYEAFQRDGIRCTLCTPDYDAIVAAQA